MNAAAASPRRPRWTATLAGSAFLVFLAACVATLSGDWSALFSRDSAERMLAFFVSFFPPATNPAFLLKVGRGAAETIAISLIGTLLAIVGGLLLALPAAGRSGPAARAASRLFLNVLRAVPELVWAAMIVIAAGLGPLAGTLALAVHTTGVLGRLFAEVLENVPGDAHAVLRENGAGAVAAFWYTTLPQALPQLVSYALYRWENNIRAAAVLGVVGAGGLGQLLYFHLSLFQVEEAATVLLAIVALVGIVDALSNQLRMRLTA